MQNHADDEYTTELNTSDDQIMQQEEDIIELIVIAMISTSTVLNLLCWYWPKIATSFIYFESGWIIFDTLLLSSDCQKTLAQCVRFIAVGVLLGVYSR